MDLKIQVKQEAGLTGLRLLLLAAVILVGWALYRGYLHYSGPKIKTPTVSFK